MKISTQLDEKGNEEVTTLEADVNCIIWITPLHPEQLPVPDYCIETSDL